MIISGALDHSSRLTSGEDGTASAAAHDLVLSWQLEKPAAKKPAAKSPAAKKQLAPRRRKAVAARRLEAPLARQASAPCSNRTKATDVMCDGTSKASSRRK